MFGQARDERRTGRNNGGRASERDEDDDYITPTELAKIKSIYTERFRSVDVYWLFSDE